MMNSPATGESASASIVPVSEERPPFEEGGYKAEEAACATSEAAPALTSEKWKAWDAFIAARDDAGFMQASWWVDFRYTCGFENFGITLTDGNEIVGGAVVLRYAFSDESCFYYIQDGPVLPKDPELAEEIFGIVLANVEERRQEDDSVVSHLRIEPRWLELPSFVKGFRSVPPLADYYLEARDTRCIDLRLSEEAILAQMKSKGRYNIGVARRHGVSIVEDTSEAGLADFYSIYEETTERQEIATKPADYFEALRDFFSPGRHGSIFFAEYEGVRIATALVIYFGPRATYFYGGSRELHRNVMAPYLMHFEVMRRAKALGHQWYDLWGIAPANEPEHPWRNFTAFKSKFGGEEVHLVRTLDYVYDEAAYEKFGELSGRSSG